MHRGLMKMCLWTLIIGAGSLRVQAFRHLGFRSRDGHFRKIQEEIQTMGSQTVRVRLKGAVAAGRANPWPMVKVSLGSSYKKVWGSRGHTRMECDELLEFPDVQDSDQDLKFDLYDNAKEEEVLLASISKNIGPIEKHNWQMFSEKMNRSATMSVFFDVFVDDGVPVKPGRWQNGEVSECSDGQETTADAPWPLAFVHLTGWGMRKNQVGQVLRALPQQGPAARRKWVVQLPPYGKEHTQNSATVQVSAHSIKIDCGQPWPYPHGTLVAMAESDHCTVKSSTLESSGTLAGRLEVQKTAGSETMYVKPEDILSMGGRSFRYNSTRHLHFELNTDVVVKRSEPVTILSNGLISDGPEAGRYKVQHKNMDIGYIPPEKIDCVISTPQVQTLELAIWRPSSKNQTGTYANGRGYSEMPTERSMAIIPRSRAATTPRRNSPQMLTEQSTARDFTPRSRPWEQPARPAAFNATQRSFMLDPSPRQGAGTSRRLAATDAPMYGQYETLSFRSQVLSQMPWDQRSQLSQTQMSELRARMPPTLPKGTDVEIDGWNEAVIVSDGIIQDGTYEGTYQVEYILDRGSRDYIKPSQFTRTGGGLTVKQLRYAFHANMSRCSLPGDVGNCRFGSECLLMPSGNKCKCLNDQLVSASKQLQRCDGQPRVKRNY